MTSEAVSWLVNKLGVDDVIDAVLYKKHVETSIDGMHCVVKSVCSKNVVAYLFTKAFADAPLEVRAAGFEMLKDAFRRGVLYHEDEGVFRRAKGTFSNVSNTAYGDEHMRQARELLANELRRCVVCEIDAYTLFERFISCVEVDSRNYTYAIRRDCGVFHVIDEDPAVALRAINKLLMTHYRVVADPDLETFETLTKIHAKTFC